jgi:uncharacterized membrane protein YcjF (UPF0283 family)
MAYSAMVDSTGASKTPTSKSWGGTQVVRVRSTSSAEVTTAQRTTNAQFRNRHQRSNSVWSTLIVMSAITVLMSVVIHSLWLILTGYSSIQKCAPRSCKKVISALLITIVLIVWRVRMASASNTDRLLPTASQTTRSHATQGLFKTTDVFRPL